MNNMKSKTSRPMRNKLTPERSRAMTMGHLKVLALLSKVTK